MRQTQQVQETTDPKTYVAEAEAELQAATTRYNERLAELRKAEARPFSLASTVERRRKLVDEALHEMREAERQVNATYAAASNDMRRKERITAAPKLHAEMAADGKAARAAIKELRAITQRMQRHGDRLSPYLQPTNNGTFLRLVDFVPGVTSVACATRARELREALETYERLLDDAGITA